MSNLDTIKLLVRNLLPANTRLSIDKHKDANDLMLDYMYIPFGVPFPYLGLTKNIPSNCSICDGSVKNIEDCPLLFAEIGNMYANLVPSEYPKGNGVTTFNIPYIQPGASIVQAGIDSTTNMNFVIGKSTAYDGVNTLNGEVKHKLLSTESGLPIHNHPFTVIMATDNGYSRPVSGGTSGPHNYNSTTNNNTAVDAEKSHNNMPPFIVGNWIIRLK